MRRLALLGLAALLAAPAPAGARLPQQDGLVDLAAAPVARVDGAAAADGAGRTVAWAGDLNRDGVSDLLVGVPDAGQNGRAASGSVYVVFSTPTGRPTIDLASLGKSGFRIDGAAAGDRTGTSLAAVGDLDGDGLGELLIGAPGADRGGRVGSGTVWLVRGKTTTTRIDLAAPGAQAVAIDGAAPGRQLGTALATVGDVDGDGTPEALLGEAPVAPQAGTPAGPGRAWVVRPPLLERLDLSAPGDRALELVGLGPGDGVGSSLGPAGDVNGDGLADVLVGAQGATGPGGVGAGAAFLVLGRPLGGQLALASLAAAAGTRLEGEAPGDAFGSSVWGAGDIDGNGRPDVLVGAYGADNRGRAGAGSAYVISLEPGGTSWQARQLARVDGAARLDLLGWCLRSADVDHDRVPDLVLGAYGAQPLGRAAAGSVAVVYGTAVSGLVDLAGLTPDRGFVVIGGSGAKLGAALDVGVDGDGDERADLLLGAPGASPTGRPGQGGAFLVQGFGTPAFDYPSPRIVRDPGAEIAIAPLVPRVLAYTGFTSFSIDPGLPTEFRFDPATGIIRGWPALLFASSYTVTMTDATGSVSERLAVPETEPDGDPPALRAELGQTRAVEAIDRGAVVVRVNVDEEAVVDVVVLARVRRPGRPGTRPRWRTVAIGRALASFAGPQIGWAEVPVRPNAHGRTLLRRAAESGRGLRLVVRALALNDTGAKLTVVSYRLR